MESVINNSLKDFMDLAHLRNLTRYEQALRDAYLALDKLPDVYELRQVLSIKTQINDLEKLVNQKVHQCINELAR